MNIEEYPALGILKKTLRVTVDAAALTLLKNAVCFSKIPISLAQLPET